MILFGITGAMSSLFLLLEVSELLHDPDRISNSDLFMIFLGGILAFTTALLHLLRGYVQVPCADLATSFPPNFYQAFSATFIFLGGKYNPTSGEFKGQHWAFLTMMNFYQFFIVILMLNVIIVN
ncbi:hypothetical protein BG003_006622 [Podila horticola]|nr:hypothetical protein BG003_006622 [Podila horticola]